MRDPIETRVQQTQRYWYVDGLGEIGTGLVLLILGLTTFVGARFQPENNLLLALGQPLLLLAVWILTGKAVRAIKERLTYPRTGYVSYPRKHNRSRAARVFLLGAVTASILAYISVAAQFSRSLLPVITGGFAALVVLLLGYRLGLLRFYVLAALTALLGILTAWLPLDTLDENAFFFSLYGLLWMVSGAITLVGYLRATRPIDPAESLHE